MIPVIAVSIGIAMLLSLYSGIRKSAAQRR